MQPTDRPEPSRALRWGRAYAGRGELIETTAAVADACAEEGLCCTIRRSGDSSWRIDAVQQRAAWHRILLRALPQRAQWLLRSVRGVLSVECDFRLFRWYAGVVILACLAIAAAFGNYLLGASRTPDGSPAAVRAGLVIIATVPVIFWVVKLLAAMGGGAVDRICYRVVDRVDRGGGLLDPRGNGGSRRYGSALGAYMGLIATLAVLVVILDPLEVPGRGSVVRVAVGVLSTLGVMVFAFALIYGLLLGRRGATFRSVNLSTGVMSAIAILLWLAPAALFLGAGDLDVDAAGRALEMAARLARGEIATPEGPRAVAEPVRLEALENLREWQLLGWLGLVGAAVMLVMSLLVGAAGLRLTLRARPHQKRLEDNRAHGTYRIAVEGDGFLRALQAAFLGIVAGIACLVVAGIGFVAVSSVAWMVPPLEAAGFNLTEVSSAVVAGALGLPPADLRVLVAARTAWLLHEALALGLLVASTGQLALARRRLRRRLRTEEADPSDPLHQRACTAVAEISNSLRRLPPVRLTIREESLRIEAVSYRFGLLRPDRILDVSRGALELLDEGALRALMAHELVHHLRHHCLLDNAMRWLCRLAFTGDGFARAIQDSLGHEAKADRVAVQELGVDPMDLLRCIETIEDANPLLPAPPPRARSRRRPPEPPPGWELPEPESEPESQPEGDGWRDAWRLFRVQYTTGRELHYWHPAYEHRKAALSALTAHGQRAPAHPAGAGTPTPHERRRE